MLTRKQMWRKIRGGGGRGGKLFEKTNAPNDSRPALTRSSHQQPPTGGRPVHPIDALAVGDSLLHILGSNSDRRGGEDKDGSCEESSSSTSTRRGKQMVSFHNQVRVVLVPSRKELHPLNEQLWWGADDYIDFRRDYIIAVKAAAAAKKKDDEQQQPFHKDPASTAGATAESGAVQTTTPQCTAGIDTVRPPSPLPPPPPPPPPPPRSSPSPLSLASVETPLPPTNAEAASAAAATKTTAATAAASSSLARSSSILNLATTTINPVPSRVMVSEILPTAIKSAAAKAAKLGACDSQWQQQGGGGGVHGAVVAAGVVPVASTISPEAMAEAAAAAPLPSSDTTGDLQKGMASVGGDGASWRGARDGRALLQVPERALAEPSRHLAVRTKWTAFAGAAAAEAAAQEGTDDEGYRTQSMSSMSDNTFSATSESDGDGDGGDGDDEDDSSGDGYELEEEDEGSLQRLVVTPHLPPPVEQALLCSV